MTDGTLAVYDPNETYIPSGVLGPAPEGRQTSFSIGWIYSDSNHQNTVSIQMPSDLIGTMQWFGSSAFDSFGTRFGDGFLSAGQSVDLLFGGFPTASNSQQLSMWFSIVAPQQIPPIAFGPTSTDDGGAGNGGGTGDPPSPNPVPEPDALALIGLGLLVTAAVTRRRRRADV